MVIQKGKLVKRIEKSYFPVFSDLHLKSAGHLQYIFFPNHKTHIHVILQ